MVNILAIDTSSKYFSLVIAKDKKISARIFKPYGRELSKKIIVAIDKALKKAGIPLEQIDCFGVGLGPGSFTGLRIGLATIKGLALPLNKRIAGVSSLDVLAHCLKEKDDGLLCPVVDAKRGLVYAAIYSIKDSLLTRKSRDFLTSVKDLLAKMPAKGKATFLGDGLPLYQNDIKKSLKPSAQFITAQELWYPRPENLLTCVREKIKKKEFSDIHKLVPFYLYPKECQISKTV